MKNSETHQRHLQSATQKLRSGQPASSLTSAEQAALARLNSETETKWREKIYRDVPLADVRRLLGGKSKAQVLAIADATGLPIGAASTDLFALFGSLEDFLRKHQQTATPAAAEDEHGRLICFDKFTAAAALKERIGRGSVRMLTDWLKAGMPGEPGGKGKPGRFVIDDMAAWARKNLDDLGSTENDENTKLSLFIKRQRARQEELLTETQEREAAQSRGDILPRGEYTQFIHEAITVARTRLLAVPKEVASLATDPDLQRKLVDEGSSRVTRILEALEKDFERGPQHATE